MSIDNSIDDLKELKVRLKNAVLGAGGIITDQTSLANYINAVYDITDMIEAQLREV